MSLVIRLCIALLAQQQINTLQQQKNAQDTQNSKLLDSSSAAKEVYSQGEGSKELVYVNLPSSYQPNGSMVGNDSIILESAGTDYVALESN